MGLALSIARRSLLQRPGRTLFSVLGISVGIATVVGIFTLDYNTVVGRSRSNDPDWRAEIEVSPSAAVQDPRNALTRVQGVTDVSAAFQSEALLSIGGETPSIERVQLVALEPESAPRLGAYQLREGRELRGGAPLEDGAPERAPEVLVGEALARRFDLRPGSRLEIARPARQAAQECDGGEWRTLPGEVDEVPSFTAFEVVGVLAREGLGRRARGEVVVIAFDVGRRMFEGAHVETRYWVKHDPAVNLEKLQTNLGEAWSYDLKKSVIIGQAADERAFRNGVRFAGLLALVLGLFVIFHTLSMSLIERVREVGVLHALGATRAQIGSVFLCEAAIVSGLGGAIGLAGGLAMARVLLRVGITTVGAGEHINFFEVPWRVILPLAAAGIGIALLGSVYPLARARRTDAVAALRGEETGRGRGVARAFRLFSAALLTLVLPAVYFWVVPVIGEAQAEIVGVLLLGLGILAVFVSLPLVVPSLLAIVCARLARPFARRWPLAGQLSARAMVQGPARVAGAVAGIALVTAGFVALRGMTRSLEGEIEVWGREAFLDKVYVRNLPRARFEEVAAKLEQYPRVLGVEPGEARTYVPFLLVGTREDELARYGPCRDDPSLIAKLKSERGVILSKRLARHRDYKIGDSVFVSTSNGRVESFPVVAISDSYGYFPHPDERLYGIVSDRWMRQDFCIDTERVSTVSVRFETGTPTDEAERIVRSAMGEMFPDAKLAVETGKYLYWWHTTDIARDFILFDIILFLTVALAGLGVLNGQLLSALERAKELGVLKALGATRRQIAGMVMLESAVVGGLGGLLGIALGAALSPVIVRALQVISGLPLPQRGAGVNVAWAWIGAVIVALLAGVYPIWRMNRSDAIAAVRMG